MKHQEFYFEFLRQTLHNNPIDEVYNFLNKIINIINYFLINEKSDSSNFIQMMVKLLMIYQYLIKLLKKENLKANENFLNDYINNLIYVLSSFLLQFKKKIENPDLACIYLKHMGNIVFDLLELRNSYLKTKKKELLLIIHLFSQNNSELLQQENLRKHFKSEEKETFVIPLIIDYLIESYNSLSSPYSSNILANIFESFVSIVNVFPKINENYYYGNDSIYGDYELLLNKLIKVTVDEKDVEILKYLHKILKILNEKTPVNFRIEREKSDKNKQYGRLDLLQSL